MTNSVEGKGDLPALVLGSSLTAVGVIRSLGRAGRTVYSVPGRNQSAIKSRWCRPGPRSSGSYPAPGELAEYLAALSIPRAVLFPCSDDWTRVTAELPATLKTRFPASIACPQAIEALTDKWRFAQITQRLDVPRPRTILVRSLEQMAALEEACYQNMFLKPLDSQTFSLRTGVKAFRLESKNHALQIMREADQNGSGGGFPILLQEYIPGPASSYYLVDGFVDRHRQVRALIARRRLRMYPLGFGNSTLSETIGLDQVEGAIQTLDRIWEDVGYRGIFDAEFKFDERDGQFKIVEINARPWWFVEFATRCGVDLCGMAYQDALGLPVEQATGYAAGRRCVYMLADVAAHCSVDPGFGGFLRWMRSLKDTEDIIFRWDDPRPGISLALAPAKRFLRKAVKFS